MNETRRYEIRNRVFDKTSIRRLAAAFGKEATAATREGLKPKLEFELVSADGTSYESESSDDVFADDTAIDLTPTRVISMGFRATHPETYDRTRAIDLRVRHGADSADLVVRGDDHVWVAAAFADVKTAVEGARPQNRFWSRYRGVLFHLTAVVSGYALAAVIRATLTLLLGSETPRLGGPPPQWVIDLRLFLAKKTAFSILVSVAVAWLQGVWVAVWLREYVGRLWPSIELDLGPEHLRIEQRRRTRLAYIGGAILLPVAIQIIYDRFNR